jgi:cytochrome b pre-mRNA-processing protein 3
MFLERLFGSRPALEKGRALYALVVERSRRPALYAELGAPDTVEGRFEVYTLHVMLLLDRMRGQGPAAARVSQALFDTYISALDDALREMGVGDLSVGKKMRKLGEAFYGRAKSYEAALAALPDRAPLEALIRRTVLADREGADPLPLTDYVAAERGTLAALPIEDVIEGKLNWNAA